MAGELLPWRGGLIRVAFSGVLLAGCYSLQPVRGVDPQIGSKIAIDVNDMGRVGLGQTIGPEIAQVEGTLVEKDTASYLLALSSVRMLRGMEQPWTGEQIRVKKEYFGSTYERRFSTGRSIGLGVITLGGFALFLASRSLFGIGTDDGGPPGCIPGVDCPEARFGRP
jgi:hypothetical protein